MSSHSSVGALTGDTVNWNIKNKQQSSQMLAFEERGNWSTQTKPPTSFPGSFHLPTGGSGWPLPFVGTPKTLGTRLQSLLVQCREPTNSTHMTLGHIGGRWVFSWLRHLCTPNLSLLTLLFHSSPQDPESNACGCSNWRCIYGCNNLSKTFGSETKPGML